MDNFSKSSFDRIDLNASQSNAQKDSQKVGREDSMSTQNQDQFFGLEKDFKAPRIAPSTSQPKFQRVGSPSSQLLEKDEGNNLKLKAQTGVKATNQNEKNLSAFQALKSNVSSSSRSPKSQRGVIQLKSFM